MQSLVANAHTRRLWRLWVLALACVVAQVLSPAALAADAEERALETRVKAAYLYRFAEFIVWPEGSFATPNSPLVIGVVGDGLGDELRQIAATRKIAGRAIEVRQIGADAALPPLHMLFVSHAARARLPQLARAAPRGVVIVAESDGVLAQGAVVNFVVVEGRVRFEVALDAAEKRGLRMSSRLLALAVSVRGAP